MSVVIIGIASVGLATFFLQLKQNFRFIDFAHFLVFGAIATLFLTEDGTNGLGIILSLLGLTALNYVTAQFKFLRKEYVRALVPLLSFIVFVFLAKGKASTFMEEEAMVVNKFLIAGGVLVALGYEIGKAKLIVLKKLLGELDEEGVLKSLQLLFTGIALFLGMFQSGSIGVLVISAVYLSASFYRDQGTKEISVSLMALATLPYLLFHSENMGVDLMNGDVLEGAFFGAFGGYFLKKLWYAERRSAVAIVLGYVIVIGLSFGLLLLHTVYANMGGMDAFIGLLVGFAVTQALVGKGYVGASILSFLLVGGLLLPSYMVNEEQAEFESMITTTIVEENGEVVEPTALPLADIVGVYELVTDSSRVSFTLGEKGETKGAFKKVSGTIEITEEVQNSRFDIEMQMDDFTTFNKYRDESLLSDEYFDAAKFPTMTFKGSKLVEKEENVWEIEGEFTMLGVTKALPVTVERFEIGGRKVLSGSGEIDRRLFGMTPSATEGNIVSFSYQVELK